MTDILDLPVEDAAAEAPPAAAPRRKLFIKSYGCQMNAYDAQKMTDLLAPAGFDETQSLDDADLVILNTCHIRERAAEKIFSELGKVREAEGRPPRRTGAPRRSSSPVASRRPRAARSCAGRRPSILSSGRRIITACPICCAAPKQLRSIDTEFPAEDKFDHLPRAQRSAIQARGVTAFVTVQEGCDKFCTFCVVPYTRGAEISRPVEKIVAEVAGSGGGRRARGDAARPERQRLSRRRARTDASGRWRNSARGSPQSPASLGCVI